MINGEIHQYIEKCWLIPVYAMSSSVSLIAQTGLWTSQPALGIATCFTSRNTTRKKIPKVEAEWGCIESYIANVTLITQMPNYMSQDSTKIVFGCECWHCILRYSTHMDLSRLDWLHMFGGESMCLLNVPFLFPDKYEAASTASQCSIGTQAVKPISN